MEISNNELLDLLADDGNLVSIRYDDADGGVSTEVIAVLFIDLLQLFCHDTCLIGVHLVGESWVMAVL